jgi:DNA modification methylase
MKLETLAIASLVSDPNNARKHDDKNLEAIVGSLQAFGQRKPIVVSSDNVVVAGNGTIEAAKRLGWEKIEIVRVPDDWSPDQIKAFALADNRTAELAAWSGEVLTAQLRELEFAGFDVAEFGFAPVEIEFKSEEIHDEIPDLPVEPTSRLGDVWQLGKHRLICGDSTQESTFAKLMGDVKADLIITDPPYGVSYTGGQNANKREMLLNDDVNVFAESIPLGYVFSKPDAALYVWFAGSKGHLAFDAVRDADYQVRAMLFWHKLKAHYGSFMSQYMPKHEPLLYCHKRGESPKWRGATNEVTVWEYDQPARNEHHPTQKPVEVMTRAIKNSSDRGDVVLDFFLGSGSTLIACEQIDRVCYGVELDPKYVDVIIKRWETLTGLKAELVKD